MSQLRSLDDLVKSIYVWPPYSMMIMQDSGGELVMILIYNENGERITIYGADDQELREGSD